MTFPSAAPKKMVSSALDSENTTSKNPCHTGFPMWVRNSMPTARSINSQSTIIRGR